jgi:hypothetical protein
MDEGDKWHVQRSSLPVEPHFRELATPYGCPDCAMEPVVRVLVRHTHVVESRAAIGEALQLPAHPRATPPTELLQKIHRILHTFYTTSHWPQPIGKTHSVKRGETVEIDKMKEICYY